MQFAVFIVYAYIAAIGTASTQVTYYKLGRIC